MWALVINPTSGSGRGASVGSYVAGFLTQRKVDHQIISGDSAISLLEHLERFIS